MPFGGTARLVFSGEMDYKLIASNLERLKRTLESHSVSCNSNYQELDGYRNIVSSLRALAAKIL